MLKCIAHVRAAGDDGDRERGRHGDASLEQRAHLGGVGRARHVHRAVAEQVEAVAEEVEAGEVHRREQRPDHALERRQRLARPRLVHGRVQKAASVRCRVARGGRGGRRAHALRCRGLRDVIEWKRAPVVFGSCATFARKASASALMLSLLPRKGGFMMSALRVSFEAHGSGRTGSCGTPATNVELRTA